uniref:Transmembrane protein 115 n=2 Tax=Ascaris TaxID=6251 RepID=A0A0M3HN58_ASCLU
MSSASAQFNALISSLKGTRPFFQIGLTLLCFGALLSLFSVTFSALSMTGAQMVSFELWRLLTNFIVERNPLLLLWSLWCLRMASSVIEPIWGAVELTRYFAIVQVMSSLLITLVSFMSYVLLKDYTFFYYVQICGSSTLCAAIYVAIKQFLPDSILLTTPIARIKNNHLPACALLVACLLAGVGAIRAIAALQIALGIQLGWIYLRFYQSHEEGEPRGDSSDHFAWATLFPSKVQPLMAAISATVFSILVRLRMCKPIVRHIDVSQLDSVNILLPGLQTRDTERRRQKALRDLTERLNRAQRVETGSWPDIEDVDDDAQGTDVSASTALAPTSSSSSEQVPVHEISEEEKVESTPPPVTVV